MDASSLENQPDTLVFSISGMNCTGCANRAERALQALPGLDEARVDFATERAFVPRNKVAAPDIKATIENAGLSAEQSVLDLNINGMTCAGCAANVEKALKGVAGVIDADINLAMERAHVTWLGHDVSGQMLADAVSRAGYRAEPRASDAELRRDQTSRQARQDATALRHETVMVSISALLTVPLLAMMVLPPLGVAYHVPAWLQLLLCIPVQFWIGGRFYVGAYRALRAGSGNMDVLVALGTSAAFALSSWIVLSEGYLTNSHLYFEASAVVITLVVFGKLIESRAKRGTTEAIRRLMALRPERARVERDGQVMEVPIEAVHIDDLVLVRPGERIPVDGEIEAGQSEADESLITGESMLVIKAPGDMVTGGAINGDGELRIRVMRIGAETTLAKIVRLVENAQTGKAQVQRLVDRVSAVFVPVVVVIAASAFAGWLLAGAGIETAILNAVSVLVIACPCALGLATPTAIVAGTGAAARAGILIKDIEVLERAHRIDLVAFDKTGTLTRGQPRVTDIVALSGSEDGVLSVAAAVQAGSEHPLARAVTDAVAERGIAVSAASDVRAHIGAGVSGLVGGAMIRIGNRQLMTDAGIGISNAEVALAAFEGEGKTAVMIATGNAVVGVIAIRDEVRPESAQAVSLLRDSGIQSVMLSGDAENAARAIANDVGIDDVRAGLKPEDKVDALLAFRARGHHTAMIGDGINDAPALAAADVGIAMGSGTDVAMETAGITLMRSDPRLVASAVQIARATWQRIRWNLFWAFIFNVIGLPLAAFGYLSPPIAGAAMALSSVTVVTSSLLLRGWKPKGLGDIR